MSFLTVYLCSLVVNILHSFLPLSKKVLSDTEITLMMTERDKIRYTRETFRWSLVKIGLFVSIIPVLNIMSVLYFLCFVVKFICSILFTKK
jgi:hypothetical protein